MTNLPRESPRQLSSAVQSMKFMSRSSEHVIRQQIQLQHQKKQDQYQWKLRIPAVKPSDKELEMTNSYLPFLNASAVAGRRSFNDFNSDIEKMATEMDKEESLNRSAISEAKDAISNKEMAARYQTLIKSSSPQDQKRKHEEAQKDDEPIDWSIHKGRKATRFSSVSEKEVERVVAEPASPLQSSPSKSKKKKSPKKSKKNPEGFMKPSDD